MLPYEDDARRDIQAAFPDELTESRKLMHLALDILGCDGKDKLDIPSTPVPGVTERARSLALGLYAKACKLFRTVILVGEAGFGGEMTILTRVLFETALALDLLLRESVTLKREGKDFDPDPTRPLTSDFRALLYFARAALMVDKRFREWGEHPELKECMSTLGNPKDIEDQTTAAKDAVGEAWWKALKKGQAGLTVKDLAYSLGLAPYHVMLYGEQSDVAHAEDAFDHFEVGDDGTHGSLALAPASEGIGRRLRLACLVFLGCLTTVHNRLQFGDAAESALNAFAKRLGVPDNN
jgi:hypothetical protein